MQQNEGNVQPECARLGREIERIRGYLEHAPPEDRPDLQAVLTYLEARRRIWARSP